MMQGWYRAQVVEVYPERDECDIKFLDYGGYARIECTGLRQIRSDFMTLPFQAVESYLINLIPLPGNLFLTKVFLFFLHPILQMSKQDDKMHWLKNIMWHVTAKGTLSQLPLVSDLQTL